MVLSKKAKLSQVSLCYTYYRIFFWSCPYFFLDLPLFFFGVALFILHSVEDLKTDESDVDEHGVEGICGMEKRNRPYLEPTLCLVFMPFHA